MIRTERLLATRERARAALAERNALSEWKVTRPGPGATDPDTGDWEPGTEVVWTGNAHYFDRTHPHVRSRADTALTIEEPTLCVAVDTPPLRIGDTVEAVQVDDPGLMDRSWRITGLPGSSYAVHRHYALIEVTPSTQKAETEEGS